MTGPQKNTIELDADRALFEGHIQGIVATLYQNERPLSGLAGLLDWRFQGVISQRLRSGAITGQSGECTYFPVVRNGIVYHLILVGAGNSESAGARSPLPTTCLKILEKNLNSLHLNKMGVSRSDFGNVSQDFSSKQLKGTSIWVVH